MGTKRLGYGGGGGETTRVENRGETTRGKRLGGETSCYQFQDTHSPDKLSDHDIVSGNLKIFIPQ